MASPPLSSSSPSPPPLNGLVAIVTGASRGIGLDIAFHLSFFSVRLIFEYSTNSLQADLLTTKINASSPNFTVPVQTDISTSIVDSLRQGYMAYTTSMKATMEAMIKILSKEKRETGITVNCMVPEAFVMDIFFAGKSGEAVRIVTEETPFWRLGQPRDIAAVVGFLYRELANGQVIRANGGYV